MQAVLSKRLLFDGGGSDRSMRQQQNGNVAEVGVPLEGSVAVVVESVDPYWDFRASMKEMVEAAEGVEGKGLEWFEEMLEWYLRMNKGWTHEYIVGAYWDLLLEMVAASSSSCSVVGDSLSSDCFCCCSSSSSSSYASCLSEIEVKEEEEEEEGKS